MKELRYEELESTLDDYVRHHIDPEPEVLHQVQRLTHLRLTYPRMCSGHLQGRLLKLLCEMVGARRILELGTFSGYSALSMAEALPTDGELHTIEVFDELEDFLTDVRSRAGEVGRKVSLHFGDALELIGPITDKVRQRDGLTADDPVWDVVFIDADKRIYDRYYELLLPLIKKGGILLADNTLWDGKVLNPHPRESDTQTLGMQRFNDLVATDTRVEKVILPMRDGLTIIRKR